MVMNGNSEPGPGGEIKLLERAVVPLASGRVAVWRGLVVRTAGGTALGQVAALLLDCRTQAVTHLLLGMVPPTAVYHLIPLTLIQRIDAETVWLGTAVTAAGDLPRYQPA